MEKGFELDFDFVEKWGRFAKPEYFRIYVYILSKYKKDNTTYTMPELAEILDIKETKVRGALEYWEAEGFIVLSGQGYIFADDIPKKSSGEIKAALSSRPSYTQTEITSAEVKNSEISYLFSQAEKILGRLLSNNDTEVLYSFVDWLGLPVEVIIMIINYAASVDKKSIRYIEKVAIDWADREIDTYEKAEAYVKELEEYQSRTRKICNILGIHGRALSTTERKYIKIWAEERNIPLDLIPEAYDRTMLKTGGKMGWAYMNKILCSWQDDGIKTLEELEAATELYRVKNAEKATQSTPKPKNKFNNYEDTNKIDYVKHAEQVLLDMLDE